MKYYRISLYLLYFIITPNFIYAGKALIQEGATITLSGKTTIASAYGPPNFGETPSEDSKDKYIVLIIQNHINIKGADGTVVNGVTRIQLAYLPEMKALLNTIGQDKISVTGKISLASSPYHHESSVLFVKSFLGKAPAENENTKGEKTTRRPEGE